MGQKVTIRHHHKTHRKKLWHQKETLSHITIHPIRYQIYHLTWIQTQVCQILLCQSHLTHHRTSIINKDDVQKMIKRDARVKLVLVAQSENEQILHSKYLHPRKNQKLLSSNWMMIYYSSVFISYLSGIQLFFSKFA